MQVTTVGLHLAKNIFQVHGIDENGETSCPNRIFRLARLAGIRAEIGYKRKPGKYGGKPSVVVDNTLDRQFDVAKPDTGRSLPEIFIPVQLRTRHCAIKRP